VVLLIRPNRNLGRKILRQIRQEMECVHGTLTDLGQDHVQWETSMSVVLNPYVTTAVLKNLH